MCSSCWDSASKIEFSVLQLLGQRAFPRSAADPYKIGAVVTLDAPFSTAVRFGVSGLLSFFGRHAVDVESIRVESIFPKSERPSASR